MKKVLFFNASFYGGGVEKVLLDIAKYLNKDNFDVTIMVMSKTGDFTDQYLALESEHIHIRSCFDYMQSGKNIFEKLKSVLRIRIAEKCMFRFPGIYHKFAIKDKFDIEVAFMHNQVNPIIACSPNKKSKKIAWVHTDLSRLYTWKEYFGTRKRQGNFYKKFDDVVFVSEHVKDAFFDLFDVSVKGHVIYNPVDTQKILKQGNQACSLSAKKGKRICAVGRLSYEKNFIMLLGVHKRLICDGIFHELVIVGDGPERENLENYIKENELTSVTLVGFQENPNKYLYQCDFSVCSSLYEGMPVVSQEALILGKPIVSSCSVVAELFGEYECGIITENTEDGLYDGLYRMLTDEDMLNRCTENAVKRGKEFSIERSIYEIEELLKN